MQRFLYFFILLFLVSCTSNTIYKEPENLIPRDSMILLLTDMYIANSARFEKNKNLQSDIKYMSLVYEKYKIDSTRFGTSNVFYTSKIETYDLLLKDVEHKIEALKKVYNDSLKVRDSISDAQRKKEQMKNDDYLKEAIDTSLIKELDDIQK